MGRTNHAAPSLLKVLEDAALQQLPAMTPQHLSNVAWGFAQQGRTPEHLFGALATAALGGCAAWGSVWAAVGCITWLACVRGWFACCARYCQPPGLIPALCTPINNQHRLAVKRQGFEPLQLAPLLWAFGRHAELSRRSNKAGPGSASSNNTSSGRMQSTAAPGAAAGAAPSAPSSACEALMHGMAGEMVQQGLLGRMQPAEVSMTAWAYAVTGIHNPSLMRALSKRAVRIVGEFSMQGLATLLWACAKLEVVNKVGLSGVQLVIHLVVRWTFSPEFCTACHNLGTLGGVLA